MGGERALRGARRAGAAARPRGVPASRVGAGPCRHDRARPGGAGGRGARGHRAFWLAFCCIAATAGLVEGAVLVVKAALVFGSESGANTHRPLDGVNLIILIIAVLIDAGGLGGGEWHRRRR